MTKIEKLFPLITLMACAFFMSYFTMPFADDREYYIRYIESPFAASRLTWTEKSPFVLLSLFFNGEIGISILIAITVFNLTYFHVSNFRMTTLGIFFFIFIFLLVLFPFILTQVRFTFASSLLLLGLGSKRIYAKTLLMVSAPLLHMATLPTIIYILLQRTPIVTNINLTKYLVITFVGVLILQFIFQALATIIINPYYASYLNGAFNGEIFVASSLIYIFITVLITFNTLKTSHFRDLILFGSILNLIAMITGATFIFKICYPFYFVAICTCVNYFSKNLKPINILLPLAISGLPFAMLLGLLRV